MIEWVGQNSTGIALAVSARILPTKTSSDDVPSEVCSSPRDNLLPSATILLPPNAR